MTALERAQQIAHLYGGYDADLRDAIHRAIVEHSNAELERRRAVGARLREAHELLLAVVEAGAHHGLPVEIRERIEKALEDRDA